eukprot:scaffold41098_cov20-Tisochrysis_lutea.AAC.3
MQPYTHERAACAPTVARLHVATHLRSVFQEQRVELAQATGRGEQVVAQTNEAAGGDAELEGGRATLAGGAHVQHFACRRGTTTWGSMDKRGFMSQLGMHGAVTQKCVRACLHPFVHACVCTCACEWYHARSTGMPRRAAQKRVPGAYVLEIEKEFHDVNMLKSDTVLRAAWQSNAMRRSVQGSKASA